MSNEIELVTDAYIAFKANFEPYGFCGFEAFKAGVEWQRSQEQAELAATVKDSLTVGKAQMARDSAELRRLCAERDKLKAKAAVPDGMVLVDKRSLGTVLQALVNAPHYIRELQATREPAALFKDNPINVLIANYEAAPAQPQSDDAMDGLVDAVKDVLDHLNDGHSIHSGTGLHACLQAAYRAAMGSKGE